MPLTVHVILTLVAMLLFIGCLLPFPSIDYRVCAVAGFILSLAVLIGY